VYHPRKESDDHEPRDIQLVGNRLEERDSAVYLKEMRFYFGRDCCVWVDCALTIMEYSVSLFLPLGVSACAVISIAGKAREASLSPNLHLANGR
jgi:hypothetical protein